MGFDLNVTIPALTVFLQGILSFFSPCVLPIIPLYMGYLSGGTKISPETGEKVFDQKKVMINTLFFIMGVSFAFFLLGLAFSTLGQFFTDNQMLITRIGGVIVVLIGLMQLGVFDKPFRGKNLSLPIKIDALRMNPITALIMGFTFSFAWTPCVGPALTTVLIMTYSASTTTMGLMLMALYTIGFTLPFLLVGIFTTKCLQLFKKHSNVVKYTVKIGAVIMILMGLMMFTGIMNGVSGYLSTLGGNTLPPTNEASSSQAAGDDSSSEQAVVGDEQSEQSSEQASSEEPSEEIEALAAFDFELQDQFGNTHRLSDYKGKVVFLNFWATWCPPCVAEMPDIQKLYEEKGLNEGDVIILGVATPSDELAVQEGTTEEVIAFLEQNGYTYPTVMDVSGQLVSDYAVSAYPTTYMIDAEGNIFGYVPGMISYEIMESIIEQTISGEMN